MLFHLLIGPVLLGVHLFSGAAIIQLVNLPTEYNASARAKQILPQLGIVSQGQMPIIRKVLGAAALTYVAATLSAVMRVLCFVLRLFAGSQQRRR
ncbi:MAG: zinc metallopeptidase [Thermoguttaceae bacterium]|nr:zinc metallopeptidase [Thermoguttaceae bacterium]